MRYELLRYEESATIMQLTEAEYRELQAAKESVRLVLNLEESMNAVIKTFEEFEVELLASSLRYSLFLFGSAKWNDHMDLTQTLSRKLSSLLSACFAHCEYSRNLLTDFFRGDPESLDRAKTFYDVRGRRASDAIQIGQLLRNLMQHEGTVISSITMKNAQRPESPERTVDAELVPMLNWDSVAKDRDKKQEQYNRQLIARLNGTTAEQGDIRPYIRRYVGALAAAHAKIEEVLRPKLSAADSAMLSAMERFNKQNGTTGHEGLTLWALNDEGLLLEGQKSTDLMIDHIVRRNKLRDRNQFAMGVAALRVVSR